MEFDLQSLFGDLINEIGNIFNNIFMFPFFGSNLQIESGYGYGSGWGIEDFEGDDPKELERRFNMGKMLKI